MTSRELAVKVRVLDLPAFKRLLAQIEKKLMKLERENAALRETVAKLRTDHDLAHMRF